MNLLPPHLNVQHPICSKIIKLYESEASAEKFKTTIQTAWVIHTLKSDNENKALLCTPGPVSQSKKGSRNGNQVSDVNHMKC
jgi:hypothetical protein